MRTHTRKEFWLSKMVERIDVMEEQITKYDLEYGWRTYLISNPEKTSQNLLATASDKSINLK